MPGPFDFTGQNINDTYQRLIQVDNGNLYNGSGSAVEGLNLSGTLHVTDHILPSQDATYDLGSPDLFFRTASIEHIQTLDSTIEFFRKESDGQGGFNRVKEGRIKIENGALKVENNIGQRAPLTASFGMFTDGVKVEGTSTFMHNLIVENAGGNHVRIDTPLTASSVSASVYYGDGSNLTGVATTGSNTFVGTQRSLYTTASIVYDGSNITQVTSSFIGGEEQITNITYDGSNVDTVAVTGSDGINKLYTLSYDGDGNVTNIIVS
jgi:hypothetical protein